MSQATSTPFADKMRLAGQSDAAIAAFEHNFQQFSGDHCQFIPEADIEALTQLPALEQVLADQTPDSSLLGQCVVIKLNGGLGTTMGMARAKSLAEVKPGVNFLDLIARQILSCRERHNQPLALLLMNSFNTRQDSLDHYQRYPELDLGFGLDFLQSQVPKVDLTHMTPAQFADNPTLEWCPPGHGDLFASLSGSGMLEKLLERGIRYAFISNADNLSATADPGLLTWFAHSGLDFLMEVCKRTAADRKGGHLAKRKSDDRIILRELAQCPDEDADSFQDLGRHKFFNTNNLWIRLDRVHALIQENGFVALPLICNRKTLNPKDALSQPVVQLETAMGSAIEVFENANAIEVPRSRFSPVKTTSDLFAIRSDAYEIGETGQLQLRSDHSEPPDIRLDPTYYGQISQLEASIGGQWPSLRSCQSLEIVGPVEFGSAVVFTGKVSILNTGTQPKHLSSGDYSSVTLKL